MFASLAELKMQLELIKKFKKNDFHLKYYNELLFNLSGSISRMVPTALLDASLSSDTYFLSVYVCTFTYCIGENRNKKKIETVPLTSLTKMKSVDFFDEKIIRSTHFRL